MRCDENNVHDIRAPTRKKRVWASVEQEVKRVILDGFKEALHRVPQQERRWVVVIDG
jgi:23S rRNA A2030 N6-methylase RlmJ